MGTGALDEEGAPVDEVGGTEDDAACPPVPEHAVKATHVLNPTPITARTITRPVCPQPSIAGSPDGFIGMNSEGRSR